MRYYHNVGRADIGTRTVDKTHDGKIWVGQLGQETQGAPVMRVSEIRPGYWNGLRVYKVIATGDDGSRLVSSDSM